MMIKRQRWKILEYTKKEINMAGTIIRKDNDASRKEALQIIDNWRAAHAYPLHVIYSYLRRMATNDGRDDIIVVERLKRLVSIIDKLQREPGMELWRMQDLGGCRFIVKTVEEVRHYSLKFKRSGVKHQYKREYDYIEHPKASGYRSLHLVYKFHSDKKETYNQNMLIEIQFRTHLQHIWATAVETMGLLTRQSLKSGIGDEEIKRFFVLASSLFAIREKCEIVPGTTHNKKDIISEIRDIIQRKHIIDILDAAKIVIDHESEYQHDKKGYYILRLDYKGKRLYIDYFQPHEIDEANVFYTHIENSQKLGIVDVVLVRAASIQSLKLAYPNYFADIKEFVSTIEHYLK